ncbi:MAG: TetR/AcrR family transcriptional regulator [Balneolaceae bacterium]|nr:TetR/AcrR family transcriptional regulator [Balneolaceae bacterium]
MSTVMESQQETLDTKEKILEAAYQIFIQKGVNGTGIKEIADQAEVNKAMLYYYFDSKDHLFTEVFKKAVKESGLKKLEVLENEQTSLFDKIKQYIDTLTEGLLQNPHIATFVMNELARHPEKLTNLLDEVIDYDRSVLEQQINDAADRYEIARISSRQLLANIAALCLGPITNKQYYAVFLNIEDEDEYIDFLRKRKGIVYDMVVSWLTT